MPSPREKFHLLRSSLGLFHVGVLIETLPAPPVWSLVQVVHALKLEEEENDELLARLIPPAVALQIKSSEVSSLCFGEKYTEASILFFEIVNFNTHEPTDPLRALELLNSVFCELDELTALAGLLKVETIGPVYMVRGMRGVRVYDSHNATRSRHACITAC